MESVPKLEEPALFQRDSNYLSAPGHQCKEEKRRGGAAGDKNKINDIQRQCPMAVLLQH